MKNITTKNNQSVYTEEDDMASSMKTSSEEANILRENQHGKCEGKCIEEECTSQEECCPECKENVSVENGNKIENQDIFKKLEEENQRLKDELLRVHAEMDNSRKRLQKLFEEKTQEKTKDLLLDIVELLDNFERAIGAENVTDKKEVGDSQLSAVIEGVKMIEIQFLQTLSNKWGLERYESVNVEFNPEKHEAMMKEESEKVSADVVVEEYAKGYVFREKVLRPAKVKVAVPKEEK